MSRAPLIFACGYVVVLSYPRQSSIPPRIASTAASLLCSQVHWSPPAKRLVDRSKSRREITVCSLVLDALRHRQEYHFDDWSVLLHALERL